MNLEEAEFGQFWKLYPKKKSKGQAFIAWQQTKSRRPELKIVLQAVVVLSESEDWTKEDGKYVPYPASWLRAWGWADVSDEDKKDVRGDAMWWKSVSGIQGKAKELSLEWDAVGGETFQKFAARVRAAADEKKIVPLQAAQ